SAADYAEYLKSDTKSTGDGDTRLPSNALARYAAGIPATRRSRWLGLARLHVGTNLSSEPSPQLLGTSRWHPAVLHGFLRLRPWPGGNAEGCHGSTSSTFRHASRSTPPWLRRPLAAGPGSGRHARDQVSSLPVWLGQHRHVLLDRRRHSALRTV